MEDHQSKSSVSQTKGKTFLIKRKLPDDAKIPKNLSSLPGLPNMLIQASSSGSQFHKPNSSQTEARMMNIKDSKRLNNSMSVQSKGQITLKTSDLFNDPNNNEPPLTEINEHSVSGEEEERQLNRQVEGPQLEMEKEYLAFLTKTDSVGFDNVSVNNNGSASIYYEWKRVNSTRLSQNSIQDINEERFFCHHEQNVIKPGERIRFVFGFISKITGVFNEEWHLKCEPPTRDPLPNLKLCGQSHISDDLRVWRVSYDQELDKDFTLKAVNEVVGDILENVRTPTPPQPDLDDPKQCQVEFEELNYGERLWYTKESINFFRSSHQEICDALNIKEEQFWNLDVQELWKMLQDVDEEDGKEFIERKLKLWTKLAKKVPIERSSLFTAMRDMLSKVAFSIPEISENLRKELDMWDTVWKEPTEMNTTPEELKLKADELARNKNEWLKRAKKKKWNDEMEKELSDDYRKKLTERVGKSILDQTLRLMAEGDILKVEQLMTPSLRWDYFRKQRINEFYWDIWMRKKTILDADIEGKRVAIKIHLKLSEGSKNIKIEFELALAKEKEEELKQQEEEKKENERLAQENAKKKGKGKPQPAQQKQKVLQEKTIDQPKKKDLKHIDQECLVEALEMIRNLLERQAKLVVIIVSYDRPFGRKKMTSSVKFFYEWLKLNLEQTVSFSESHIVENFDENVESQIYPENSALVLENIFFEPMETQIIIDDQGNLQYPDEPDIESETPYCKLLPYAPIYIIADKTNLFSNQLPSINHMVAEQTILGTNILRDIQTISYNIQGMQNRSGVIIIGGDLTADKLLAIDTLIAHCSSIILLGKIGYQFFCTMFDVEADNVPPNNRRVIKQLLDCMSNDMIEKAPEKLKRISHVDKYPKPKAKLICPLDFIISKLPEIAYDPANSDHLALMLNNIQQYVPTQIEGTQKKVFDLKPDQILLDFGPDTLSRVTEEVLSAQRVIWIDSANLSLHNIQKTITVPDLEGIALLSKLKAEEAQRELIRQEKLKEKKGGKGAKKQAKDEEQKIDLDIKTTKNVNVPVFNETNRSIGSILFQLQQNKKLQHEKAQKAGSFLFHNFNEDCVITIVGTKLEDELNREDFYQILATDNNIDQEEQSNFQEGQRNEEEVREANEGDRISQLSGQQHQEKIKVNQVKQYLSDYCVQDQDFILKVLAGYHIDCLKNIDEYPKKSNSEIDEEQYFEQDQSV